MLQVNEQTKLFECNELLGEEDQFQSDKFLEVDEQIFTFRKKKDRWLKCVKEEKQTYTIFQKTRSKETSSTSSHRSSKSSASRKSNR